ncbi:hypothetical protein B0H14DRAFT_1670618 [Mycena olivaceomarginata]|nr:hypothetical protein B0H14DRAFT_1670618 [Mycena olivaceomarginata]
MDPNWCVVYGCYNPITPSLPPLRGPPCGLGAVPHPAPSVIIHPRPSSVVFTPLVVLESGSSVQRLSFRRTQHPAVSGIKAGSFAREELRFRRARCPRRYSRGEFRNGNRYFDGLRFHRARCPRRYSQGEFRNGNRYFEGSLPDCARRRRRRRCARFLLPRHRSNPFGKVIDMICQRHGNKTQARHR